MQWYEEEVQRVEKEHLKLAYTPQMVFYGSSSVRMWDSLYEDFADFKPVNLGFGGSTLEACVHFFHRIMQPYKYIRQLVLYAGDNDLGDGKLPGDVLHYFKNLCSAIEGFFPQVQVFYVSIKPSIARWNINHKIVETNFLIENTICHHYPTIHYINVYNSMLNHEGRPNPAFFKEDGLHLTPQGYTVWKNIMLSYFSANLDNNLM
jgi:lysophospholipase L1-like esterase